MRAGRGSFGQSLDCIDKQTAGPGHILILILINVLIIVIIILIIILNSTCTIVEAG
jgi:hypothetical protein